MAVALSADQELAMKAFMESLGGRVLDRAVALRFLLARKYDAARAAELYRQHEDTRRREGLDVLEPRRDPLRTELATGKFTVLLILEGYILVNLRRTQDTNRFIMLNLFGRSLARSFVKCVLVKLDSPGKINPKKTRDDMGAAIAVFTASKHNPTESTHQTTLQGLVYQLDAALQSIETQRAGLVFIYDMTHAKYSNFDYDLSQKIITMLKGGYPAKLKKVLIVTPPFWFDGPFRILRLFLRKKLRDRVHTVSAAHLASHVPRAALPDQLGGALRVDHDAWLNQCWKSFESDDNTSQDSPLKSSYLYQNGNCASLSDDGVSMTTDSIGPPPSDPDMRLSAEGDAPRDRDSSPTHNDAHTVVVNGNGHHAKLKVIHNAEDEDMDLVSNSGRSTSMSCSEEGERLALSSEEDNCSSDGGLTPEELLDRIKGLGRHGLVAEYDDIRSKPPAGTFTHSKLVTNLAKNRYSDVLCYDHSRVTLTPEHDASSDYINANYVDGYKQKNAFICTQGPLPKTYVDFWQMVWERECLVIVMTTKAVERGRVKCGQYWPANAGQTLTHGHFQVLTDNVKANQDYIVSDLILTNLQTSVSRVLSHWQYVRWPDYGVPGRARPVLHFLEGVRNVQASATRRLGESWKGHSRGPPIVVHCSAGIGRTGTFLTLDICTSRLEESGRLDVRACVERVRTQRAHSIQTPEQYVFCHLALVEYALIHGYLQHADWDGFVDQDDS